MGSSQRRDAGGRNHGKPNMDAAMVDDWFSSLPWIDRPDANIAAYLESLDEDTPFDLRPRLQEWQSRGVVVFQDVIPHDLIDSMLNDVEYLKLHYRDFELEVELRGRSNRSRSTHQRSSNSGVSSSIVFKPFLSRARY